MGSDTITNKKNVVPTLVLSVVLTAVLVAAVVDQAVSIVTVVVLMGEVAVMVVVILVILAGADGLTVEAVVKERVAAAAVTQALVIDVLLAKAFSISCWLFKNNIQICFLSFTAPAL